MKFFSTILLFLFVFSLRAATYTVSVSAGNTWEPYSPTSILLPAGEYSITISGDRFGGQYAGDDGHGGDLHWDYTDNVGICFSSSTPSQEISGSLSLTGATTVYLFSGMSSITYVNLQGSKTVTFTSSGDPDPPDPDGDELEITSPTDGQVFEFEVQVPSTVNFTASGGTSPYIFHYTLTGFEVGDDPTGTSLSVTGPDASAGQSYAASVTVFDSSNPIKTHTHNFTIKFKPKTTPGGGDENDFWKILKQIRDKLIPDLSSLKTIADTAEPHFDLNIDLSRFFDYNFEYHFDLGDDNPLSNKIREIREIFRNILKFFFSLFFVLMTLKLLNLGG